MNWTTFIIGGIIILSISPIIAIFRTFYEILIGDKIKLIRIGKRYEKHVCNKLKKVFKTPALRNLLFGIKDGTTEMDAAYVTKKGIFCIEMKHRSNNYICGNDTEKLWKCGSDVLRNPLFQNMGHIKAMSNVIKNPEFYNMVCVNVPFDYFDSNGCMGKAPLFFIPNKTRNIIAQIGMGYASGYITKECIKKFKTEYKKLPDVYSKKEVMDIKSILKTHIGTRKELRKHKNFVIRKEKYLHNL